MIRSTGFLALVGAILFILLSFSGCTQVDTGYRGVKLNFGKVVEGPLAEGIYFYNPVTTTVVKMDTRTKLLQGKTAAYTKDVQQANIEYAVNYSLAPSAVVKVYQSVGQDFESKLIPPVIEATIKQVMGQYEAVNLISAREQAKDRMLTALQQALSPSGILVSNINISNIDFSDAFENAVEAKVTAIQRAAEAQNKTVQVEEEAKQKVIGAEAEAKSMQIRAKALEQNKNLVSYEAVQRWDGQLPTIMTGSSVPFIMSVDGISK